MSGPLTHSPADVVRTLLVALGLGTDPPDPGGAAGAWPVYAAQEPGTPDDCLTVFDTAGKDDGRRMTDGRRIEHHGVQVRVRSATHAGGYAKARAVAVALDAAYQRTVTLGGSGYLVHSVQRVGDVLALGKEVPHSRRSLFTVNALVTLAASDD